MRTKRGWIVGLALLVLVVGGWWVARPRVNVQEVRVVVADVWSTPVFSPDGNHIAFTQRDKIVVTTLDGVTQEWPIGEGIGEYLQWLTDTQIVFQRAVERSDRSYRFQFWVLDLQLGETSLLNERVFMGNPSPFSISPLRDKLAFVQWERAVYTLDLQTDSVKLVPTPVFDGCVDPEWSADELWVVYFCFNWPEPRQKINKERQIWRTNVNSREFEPLSSPHFYSGFSLSPDNERLVYLQLYDTLPRSFRFYVAPVEDGILRLEDSASLPFFAEEPSYPSVPSWSPDGRCLTFTGSFPNPHGNDFEFEAGVWYVCFE